MEDVKAVSLIEFAPLPVVDVLEEDLSDPVVIGDKSTVEEERTVSVFVNEESSQSGTMTNHSILKLETAQNGSVIEKQHTVSVVASDEPSVPSNPSGLIALEGEEEGAPVTVEDVEENYHSAAPFLHVASDSLATFEPIADEEEERETGLKGEIESKPEVTDLIAYEEAVDDKRPTVAQLMLEKDEEEKRHFQLYRTCRFRWWGEES